MTRLVSASRAATQAIGRTLRLGQTQQVKVRYFLMENSIEEDIYEALATTRERESRLASEREAAAAVTAAAASSTITSDGGAPGTSTSTSTASLGSEIERKETGRESSDNHAGTPICSVCAPSVPSAPAAPVASSVIPEGEHDDEDMLVCELAQHTPAPPPVSVGALSAVSSTTDADTSSSSSSPTASTVSPMPGPSAANLACGLHVAVEEPATQEASRIAAAEDARPLDPEVQAVLLPSLCSCLRTELGLLDASEAELLDSACEVMGVPRSGPLIGRARACLVALGVRL